MATKIVCDGGCGTEWDSGGYLGSPAITGERTNGMGGGGLPSGEFHWCYDCAKAAFQGLKMAAAFRDMSRKLAKIAEETGIQKR